METPAISYKSCRAAASWQTDSRVRLESHAHCASRLKYHKSIPRLN